MENLNGAISFGSFILSNGGRKILEDQGLNLIKPVIEGNIVKVPSSLKLWWLVTRYTLAILKYLIVFIGYHSSYNFEVNSNVCLVQSENGCNLITQIGHWLGYRVVTAAIKSRLTWDIQTHMYWVKIYLPSSQLLSTNKHIHVFLTLFVTNIDKMRALWCRRLHRLTIEDFNSAEADRADLCKSASRSKP